MDNKAAAVSAWLGAGAEMNAGLLLFSRWSTNTRLPALVRINPTRYRRLLIERLCAIAGIDVPRQSTEPATRRRYREEFPFLGDPDCPPELKILAADKLTAHQRYTQAHDRLFNCTSLDECFQTAREVIDNFVENRAIYDEMEYYREHRTVLGKHRIFSQLRRLGELRKLSIVQLMAEQRRLRSAIWRVKDEIKKGTKPHLITEREQRLRSKETLLEEVNKLIEAYNIGKTV
jgi:hypothetical protein